MTEHSTPLFVAVHPPTGLKLQVYMVDTFYSSFLTTGEEVFAFDSRRYETELGQTVLLKGVDSCVLVTDIAKITLKRVQ